MIHTKNRKRRARHAHWANHFDNAILDLMNGSLPEILHKGMVQTTPLTNIVKRENEFDIEMAVPGLSKEQITIQVEQDQLIISSDQESKLAEGESYSKNEFNYNKFERKFNLGENIDQESISAKCENGLLKVTLKVKAKEETTIKVDIK